MPVLSCNTLLQALNAKPYSNWGTDDDPLLGDMDLQDLQKRVLNINLEMPMDEWKPVPCSPEQADDPRLPNWFLDGAVASLEVAGSASDALGYPRVIRAGQMGVGATSRFANHHNKKKFWRFFAINASGYSAFEIEPLRIELRQAYIPHELIEWQITTDDDPSTAFDLMSVRALVRNRVRDAMLTSEQELVKEINDSIYVDGRYADHVPNDDSFLVVGIVKSQRARYLVGHPLQVLYSLKEGERTPAFLIERQRGHSQTKNEVITFYVRLTSPSIVGPSGGLARIEISQRYFENREDGTKLFNAIAADLIQLRTHDTTYARGAVTIEPIRSVERELHLIFRDTQMAATESMYLLQ